MNDSITFKGVSSSTVGIVVTELPEITVPEERVTFTDVPGRSGSLSQTQGDDVFNDLTLAITCYCANPATYASQIARFFRGAGALRLPNRSGGYYEARVTNQIAFSKILRGRSERTFGVNFRCKPLFRLDSGETEATIASSGDFISNPTDIHSRPLIKIVGSGDITLIVGTQTVYLSDVDTGITLDCELQEAYYGTELQNSKMSGSFPVLNPGSTAISWSGTVTSVKVTPRWVER